MSTHRASIAFALTIGIVLPACGGGGGAGTPDGAAGTTGNAGTTGSAGTTGGAGTTGAAGTTGTAGTTGAAGTGAASTVPLTQRPARGTMQCQMTRGRTDHSPRSWNTAPALVTTSGGTAFLIRSESMLSASPGAPAQPQLVASTLSTSGTFGASTIVPSTPSDVGDLAAAPRGTGFAAVYVEGTALRFAAFDAAGAIAVAPKTVLTGVDTLSTIPSMAAGPDGGFGVVYAVNTPGDKREVRFVVLTADGAMRATPRVLSAPTALQAFVMPGPMIVSDASGYAMTWRSPNDARGGIDFAKADAAGAETVARRRISVTDVQGVVVGGTAGFDRAGNALLAVGGGFIAAWTEVKQGDAGSGSSAEVRIVRLDSGGVAQGVPVPVRPGVTDIDEGEPVLVKVGTAAAIAWAHGTHIYICGGCVPDHRIDLLPIDPSDLTPLGSLVSLTNGAASPATKAGGLLQKKITVVGNALLTAYQLTFHVSATPGSATFTCAAP
jgi:hypothetical protein